jgi:hypothetical protein
LTVAKVATGYRIRAKQVAGKDADEVEVVLPDGAVMALAQTSWGKFEGVWQTTAQGGVVKLRVVVRDRALNQAVTELVVGGQ